MRPALFVCLLSVAAYLLTSIEAPNQGKLSAANPAATTKLAVSDVEASKPDLPRVNVVAQVAAKPDVSLMTLPELQDALDCAKQEVAAIEGEIARRTPKQVAKSACQCGVTGVCTCGNNCPCSHPKDGVAKAPANPTVTYQNVQETTYETRVGPFGGMWQVPVTRVVSRPVATSQTTYVTQPSSYVSRPSSVVTTSYPSSSVKVTTPAARSSTVIYSTPRASRCVIGPDGVKRCYP